MRHDLKPCECGNRRRLEIFNDDKNGYWYAHCKNCHRTVGGFISPSDAIEAWNRTPTRDRLYTAIYALRSQRDKSLAEVARLKQAAEINEIETMCAAYMGETFTSLGLEEEEAERDVAISERAEMKKQLDVITEHLEDDCAKCINAEFEMCHDACVHPVCKGFKDRDLHTQQLNAAREEIKLLQAKIHSMQGEIDVLDLDVSETGLVISEFEHQRDEAKRERDEAKKELEEVHQKIEQARRLQCAFCIRRSCQGCFFEKPSQEAER